MLYPAASETRTVLSLNGIWNFALQQPGEGQDPKTKLVTDQMMAVPASFNDQSGLAAIREHDGFVWYERDFSVPSLLMNQDLFLHFGSATHEAWVFVNGQEAGHHKGGFTPFMLPVNALVHAGTNRVTVKLSNLLDDTTLPVGNYTETKDDNGNTVYHVDENFDFFNYAGLHRNVTLLALPKSRVEDIEIHADVALEKQQADLHVTVQATGEYDKVQIQVKDEAGQVVGEGEGLSTTIGIDHVQLWQPLAAYLYNVQVTLLQGDQVVDTYTEPFGVRTVEVKNRQFLINGKPFYFKGFGKHEDTFVNGRGMNEAYNVLDLNLLKEMGANSFRTSHYPYSEEMMRLCDREGIVVIDETPAVGLMPAFNFNIDAAMMQRDTSNFWREINTQEAHKQAIEELIARDKNHACVVMWSIANEPATQLEGAHEYFAPLFALARELDPQNRPCTFINIMVALPEKDKATDLVDVIALNRYYGWYVNTGDLDTAAKLQAQEIETWATMYPDKPIMFTEFGADTVAGMHSAYNEPFSEEYQVNYYKMNAAVFDQFDYFIGEQLWNFADFQTKFGIQRVQGNKKGIFTRSREPKAAAIWLGERWNNIPNFDYKK